MKTKTEIELTAAFPDSGHQPNDAELKSKLGPAFTPFETLCAKVRQMKPEARPEWNFSRRSGWNQIWVYKKRRLFYFLPREDNFRLSLILGDLAIADLKRGPHAAETNTLLEKAVRYPEGTAFFFDRSTLEPELVSALLEAKLQH